MSKLFVNLDAAESAFFTRELTAIKSKTYDILYPEFKYSKMIPISNEAGPGADTIVYRQFDMVGMVKLISNYADDLPRADVLGKEYSVIVKSVGGSYGYNVQEIRAAQMAGRPLNIRRADAVRKAYEQYVNQVAWLADGSAIYGGMYGLLFNPNVVKTTPTTGTWTTATADQILADFAKVYGEQLAATKGVEIPDTCLVPPAVWARITTIPRGSTSDITVLDFLKKVYPGITFDWVNELYQVTSTTSKKPSGSAGATNCLVLYKRDPNKLTLEIPQGFEMFPAQERMLEYVVPAHGRIAGVVVYYPLSVYIMEGV
jgi:hypothetical protein